MIYLPLVNIKKKYILLTSGAEAKYMTNKCKFTGSNSVEVRIILLQLFHVSINPLDLQKIKVSEKSQVDCTEKFLSLYTFRNSIIFLREKQQLTISIRKKTN